MTAAVVDAPEVNKDESKTAVVVEHILEQKTDAAVAVEPEVLAPPKPEQAEKVDKIEKPENFVLDPAPEQSRVNQTVALKKLKVKKKSKMKTRQKAQYSDRVCNKTAKNFFDDESDQEENPLDFFVKKDKEVSNKESASDVACVIEKGDKQKQSTQNDQSLVIVDQVKKLPKTTTMKRTEEPKIDK